MPERSKGADLRSAGCNVRVGSNPTSGMSALGWRTLSSHNFGDRTLFWRVLKFMGVRRSKAEAPTWPPWPNWTRRAPPKGEIAGSSPAGGGPSGLMDKALVSGAKDCGFESHLGWQSFFKGLEYFQ